MAGSAVYILTRNRISNIRRIVPRWLGQGIYVVLLVEMAEADEHWALHKEMKWSDRVTVTPLVSGNRGIGHARWWSVINAKDYGFKSIIMSDDDIMPKAGNFGLLLRESAKPGVLGVGCSLSGTDRFAYGALTANSGVILCPGSWGSRLFGLNVGTALALGNFDLLLDCAYEDNEMQRLGIASGIPWLVHCDTWATSIGSRYSAGGLSSLYSPAERAARELANHKVVYSRWPEYISKPGTRMRMAWGRMLDDYIPGWREQSAIHGGKWRG